jgi:hypothetical protein
MSMAEVSWSVICLSVDFPCALHKKPKKNASHAISPHRYIPRFFSSASQTIARVLGFLWSFDNNEQAEIQGMEQFRWNN